MSVALPMIFVLHFGQTGCFNFCLQPSQIWPLKQLKILVGDVISSMQIGHSGALGGWWGMLLAQNMLSLQNMQNMQNMQNLQNKLKKPNLPNQAYQTKPTKPGLPNKTYQTKPTKPNRPIQTYKTKPTKANLPNQTKSTQPIKHTEPNLPNQNTGQSSQRLGPQCFWQCLKMHGHKQMTFKMQLCHLFSSDALRFSRSFRQSRHSPYYLRRYIWTLCTQILFIIGLQKMS